MIFIDSVARDGIVIKTDEECDSARNVNERVDPIDPGHHQRMSHEISLDPDLPEDAQLLLHPNYLECVSSGHIDGAFLEGDGGECTTELICLSGR